MPIPDQTMAGLVRIQPAELDELRTHARRGHLFAVLDACDETLVPAKLFLLPQEQWTCLYLPPADEEYWDIAPYLAHVDEPLLEWIHDSLWNAPWGIFAVSRESLEGMRKHFRQFLLVKYPDGDQAYFRFYDPRVLPIFMSTCNAGERDELFGAIDTYYASNPATSSLHSIRRL